MEDWVGLPNCRKIEEVSMDRHRVLSLIMPWLTGEFCFGGL